MRVLVCIAIGKSGFMKKILKMAGDPHFFSVSLFSSTSSCEGVKKIGLFMFKIPDFSLAPRLCQQAGLDLDPHTLVSGDLRHFCMPVRCAAHCAGATLKILIGLWLKKPQKLKVKVHALAPKGNSRKTGGNGKIQVNEPARAKFPVVGLHFFLDGSTSGQNRPFVEFWS